MGLLAKKDTIKNYLENKNVQKEMCFNYMIHDFFDSMKLLTVPYRERHTWLTNLKDFFIKAQKIDSSVFDFCSEKLEKIFDYAYENDLNDYMWSLFGYFMWRILYQPERAYEFGLQKEIVDFALKQFNGKRLTVEKINGVYTIIFLEHK